MRRLALFSHHHMVVVILLFVLHLCKLHLAACTVTSKEAQTACSSTALLDSDVQHSAHNSFVLLDADVPNANLLLCYLQHVFSLLKHARSWTTSTSSAKRRRRTTRTDAVFVAKCTYVHTLHALYYDCCR
jgi:hypothetical protein